jgi:hypothetical protein
VATLPYPPGVQQCRKAAEAAGSPTTALMHDGAKAAHLQWHIES